MSVVTREEDVQVYMNVIIVFYALYVMFEMNYLFHVLPYLTEVSSLVRGWLRDQTIFFDLQLLSLAGNTWLQCCLLGQLSRYVLAGHGILCLLSFLLLVIFVEYYALYDFKHIVISSS